MSARASAGAAKGGSPRAPKTKAAGAISGGLVLRLLELVPPAEGRALLARQGLSIAALRLPGSRVGWAAVDALVDDVAAHSRIEGLGLRLALVELPESYGMPGLLLATSPTFAAGLQRALAYQRLWGDGERFQLLLAADTATLSFQHPVASPHADAVFAVCALAESLLGLRRLVEEGCRAQAVAFRHVPEAEEQQRLEAFFGVRPRFGAARNELVVERRLMEAPLRSPVEQLRSAMEQGARRLLEELPEREALADRVRRELAARLEGGPPSLDALASALRMGRRTLQRQLGQQRCTFAGLLDEVRRQAEPVLAARGLTAKEIAWRLGFADVGGLARARRRWRGGGDEEA